MTALPHTLVDALGINPAPVSDLINGDEDARLFALFEAVRTNKANVAVNEAGVLTAALSKSSVRAVRRAQKAQRLHGLAKGIVASLQANRPQKIGPIVKELAAAQGITDKEAVQKFRADVLEACRGLRDERIVIPQNATASNFHLQWTLAASPGLFPVPVVEPEAPAETAVEAESDDAGQGSAEVDSSEE